MIYFIFNLPCHERNNFAIKDEAEQKLITLIANLQNTY